MGFGGRLNNSNGITGFPTEGSDTSGPRPVGGISEGELKGHLFNVDRDFRSPHHTLGDKPYNASPGNHNHYTVNAGGVTNNVSLYSNSPGTTVANGASATLASNSATLEKGLWLVSFSVHAISGGNAANFTNCNINGVTYHQQRMHTNGGTQDSFAVTIVERLSGVIPFSISTTVDAGGLSMTFESMAVHVSQIAKDF